VLILIHGLAHPRSGSRDVRHVLAACFGLAFLSLIVTVASLFVPAQQKEKSRAFLGSEEVYYFPPNLSYEPPPGRTILCTLSRWAARASCAS
jgi:hypothetical protein